MSKTVGWRSSSCTALWGPLALYALLVTIGSFRLVDQINPDGVSYLRNARLLADGRFSDSVSSYWSPLLSWLVAPLLRVGIDSLVAARVVLAVCGGLLLAASWALMNLLAPRPSWRVAIMTAIAVNAVPWTFLITPDVLLGACVIAYGLASLTPELSVRPGLAWRCGVLAGVAFLAKAYALPFFLVHFPLSLALSYWLQPAVATGRRARHASALVASAAAGLLGFFMIAGPWMAVLSLKYGRLTVTTSAAFNHALVNPSPDDRPAFEDRLIEPLPGRISIWETPELLKFRDWSPFQSAGHAAAQGRVMVDGLSVFGRSVDAVKLTILLIIASPALALRYRRDRQELRRLLWSLGTIVIYSGGFLFVLCERRYFMPVVVPIGLFLCATVSKFCLDGLQARAPRYHRLVSVVVGLMLVSSFAYRGLRDGVSLFTAGAPAIYRQAGERLRQVGAQGPIVSDRWASGLYVAYHAGLPYLGAIAATDGRAAPEAPDVGGARVFVRWDHKRPSDTQLILSQWRALVLPENEGRAYGASVWLRPSSRQVQ
jgi:hypothetical protein